MKPEQVFSSVRLMIIPNLNVAVKDNIRLQLPMNLIRERVVYL